MEKYKGMAVEGHFQINQIFMDDLLSSLPSNFAFFLSAVPSAMLSLCVAIHSIPTIPPLPWLQQATCKLPFFLFGCLLSIYSCIWERVDSHHSSYLPTNSHGCLSWICLQYFIRCNFAFYAVCWYSMSLHQKLNCHSSKLEI